MKRVPPPSNQKTRRHRRAAISTEYMLVLACIVIPLGIMVPTLVHMVAQYGHRIITVISLPFG